MTLSNISAFNFRSLYRNNTSDVKDNFRGSAFMQPVQDTYSFSNFSWAKKKAELYKKAGNECVNNNLYSKAINLYQKAIADDPDYGDAYFNLAKTFKNIGETDKAILNYEKYLKIDPNDAEVLSNLGECYKDKKLYTKAQKVLEKAIAIDPKMDFAVRQYKEIEYLKFKEIDPASADMRREGYATENMKKSLNLIKQFYPPQVISQLKDITFCFDETDSLSGHQNIAQYENSNRRIVVTNKYVWASPEVIGSYLAHEIIHSLDRDAITSIKEEQEAYTKSVEFWNKFSNGIKDPEMDFAASLYNSSPEALDNKVAEIYTTRDNSIPLVSPHHGLAAKELRDKEEVGLFKAITANIKSFFINLFSKKQHEEPASVEMGLYASARR